MSAPLHIFQLYDFIDKKLKRALTKIQYTSAIKKIDSMIGLIYGSVTGLMCGAATQAIGPKAAEQRFRNEMPFCSIKDSVAIGDPILGQLTAHITELKNAKWDSDAFKTAVNYKSVIGNSSFLKVEPQPQLVDQIRTGKSAQLYNLSGEDFYLRVPLSTLFGDSTMEVVIGKVLQTHTSFEPPAYAILTASIIQLVLLSDDIFTTITDWNQVITDKLFNVLDTYREIYTSSCVEGMPIKSEADKLRVESMKLRLEDQYKSIHGRLMGTLDMFADTRNENKTEVKENLDHLSENEKAEAKITSIFVGQLNNLDLSNKQIYHPMLLAIWCVKTLNRVHEIIGMDNIEPVYLSELMLKSVAVRSGMSAYNTMIVGSILGAVFGCTQIPEIFYESMDEKLMDRINRDILDLIAAM